MGIASGFPLRLAGIRNRFFVLLALFPALALIDVKLARSNRPLRFRLRAWPFGVCTVFACPTLTRFILNVR